LLDRSTFPMRNPLITFFAIAPIPKILLEPSRCSRLPALTRDRTELVERRRVPASSLDAQHWFETRTDWFTLRFTLVRAHASASMRNA
jgi:hypothetical protein